MGAVPIIGAGVSLISGVANISAKNKAADAQRQAIAAESYQRATQQMANDATLLAQQQLAQQNYQNSTLARLAQFQQAEFGLQVQDQMARLNAQQQRYAIESGALQQAIQGSQQGQALQRQATQIQTAANTQRQQSDAEQTAVAEAGTQAAAQIVQALTAEERKRLSLEAAGQIGTESNKIARDRDLIKRVASSLAAGLNIDRDVLARGMQAMNEEDLITAAERLGLLENAANTDMVAANLRMMGISADAGLDAVQRNYQSQRGAIDIARQQQLMGSQLDQQNAMNAYAAQDYSMGVQRSLGAVSNVKAQENLAGAYRNTRGASLMDWLNTGVSTYGAVSPLLNRPAAPLSNAQRFMSGGDYGFARSGWTDTELGNYGTTPLPSLDAGFTGDYDPNLRFGR